MTDLNQIKLVNPHFKIGLISAQEMQLNSNNYWSRANKEKKSREKFQIVN